MGIERGAEDTTPAKSAGWGQRQQQVRGCSGLVSGKDAQLGGEATRGG